MSSFDVLQSEKINNALYNFTDVKTADINPNFVQMGFETVNIIRNLGSILIYVELYFILAFVAFFFKMFEKISKM